MLEIKLKEAQQQLESYQAAQKLRNENAVIAMIDERRLHLIEVTDLKDKLAQSRAASSRASTALGTAKAGVDGLLRPN